MSRASIPRRNISVLDGAGAALGQRLIVALRSDRIGMTGDDDANHAGLFRRHHGGSDDVLSFRRQVRLVEVEEDDEPAYGRRWRGRSLGHDLRRQCRGRNDQGRLDWRVDDWCR